VSTSEARRSLSAGAVRIDGEVFDNGSLDIDAVLIDGKIVQLGKRRFARVRLEDAPPGGAPA
jgi:tyrosyl-tRNA synthetase